MRKLFYILVLTLFSACNKQEDIIDKPDNEDKIELDHSDISGVWTLSSR